MARRKWEPGEPADPVGDCLSWPYPASGIQRDRWAEEEARN